MSGRADRPARPAERHGRGLLLATTNPAKLARLRWVFADLGLTLRGLPPGAGPAPDEVGASFAENAALKARHWSGKYGGLVAASDGGMEVPALGARWNALRTARMAGPGADDVARANHLLAQARHLRGPERAVRWSEALALARAGELLATFTAHGTSAILVEAVDPADVRPGFWAGSLCYLPERGTTLAALPDEDLAQTDPTWSSLRASVRRYFASGQADA